MSDNANADYLLRNSRTGDPVFEILTNEAPTLKEKFHNPRFSSTSKKVITDIPITKTPQLIKPNLVVADVVRPRGKKIDDVSVKNIIPEVKPEDYNKVSDARFARYSGIKSPEDPSVKISLINELF